MDYRANMDAAAVTRELQTNLEAPLDMVRLALPMLLSRPHAAILNITSGLALVPKASAPVYCATKAALRSFTRSLRWQLEDSPVRVFEALPPLVETSMTQGRGSMSKMDPATCARIILDGMAADRPEILVGKSRLLAWVARLWPSRAEAIMRSQ